MGRHSLGWGLFLLIVGGLLLASNLGYLKIDPLWRFWPLILVWWGLTILWDHIRKKE